MNADQKKELAVYKTMYINKARTLKQEAEKLSAFLLIERQVEEVLKKLMDISSGKIAQILEPALKTIYGKEKGFNRKSGSKRVTVGGYSLPNAKGLGIAEVVGVITRVIGVARGLGGKLSTIILDEPLSNTDDQVYPATAMFLKEITKKLNINMLIVSHRKEIRDVADVVYRFHLNEKEHTVIRRITTLLDHEHEDPQDLLLFEREVEE